MSEAYLGEIRMVGFNFAPLGWACCDGQILLISQNNSLFALIGTTYGGDGQTTFALPDLRGRVPFHAINTPGQAGGEETVRLTANQAGAHTHAAQALGAVGSQTGPGGGVWAAPGPVQYSSTAASLAMNSALITSAGEGQPHDNMMPFLVLNFIICLDGYWPPRD